MTANDFTRQFVGSLIRDGYSTRVRNTDWRRSGAGHGDRILHKLQDLFLSSCHRFGLTTRRYNADRLAFILERLDDFDGFHRLLADGYSRDLMIKLLEYRVLGPRHVQLPRNTDEFWSVYDSVDRSYARKLRTQPIWNGQWFLNQYEMPVDGKKMTLLAHPLTILGTFLLEQYVYARDREMISVETGDVVIDGGGCWGDTALYFSAKAGNAGKVLTFEFLDENLEVLKTNLELNPELAKKIILVPRPIWNQSGITMSFESNGPGTKISSAAKGGGKLKIRTVSIDDVVKTENLPRVDFIKMDIEGAELDALKGAGETIKKFRPKLAISVYHKQDDFLTIPQWINSLGLGYRFFLDHFTIHSEETILFAKAPR